MQSLNKNIEEIKLLLPDYISGNIDPGDKKLVDDTIVSSPELQELLSEMTGALGFVSKVKFKEPEPLYWVNLLPRIHERIEQAEEKKFSWDKVLSYWKVFVPVTAVIILAIIYFTVINNNDNSTLTEKKTEKVNIDTTKKTDNIEKKEVVKETNTNENTVEKKKGKITHQKNEKIEYEPVKEDIVKENQKQLDESEDFAQAEIEEESIFTGSTAGMEEEMENDLNNLNDNEQDRLVQELLKSNL